MFQPPDGLKHLSGFWGGGIMKISAISLERRIIKAPVCIFHTQEAFRDAFKADEFTEYIIIVFRFPGPQANGMPELHSLTPLLSNLQDKGFNVALVTDGRMSGASGKIPAAIHVFPEAVNGGNIGRIKDGDIITVDANLGKLEVEEEITNRPSFSVLSRTNPNSFGRSLFAQMRSQSANAEDGGGLSIKLGRNI